MSPWYTKQKGFTLIELVAVIVLLGVVALSTTQFIKQGVGIYADTARRDNLQQIGRFAVERVSRELRNALPNSIRVNGNCLEFIPIKGASTYLQSVTDAELSTLDVVDFSYSYSNGDLLAVYPIDTLSIYNSFMLRPLAAPDAASGGQQTLNFSSAPVSAFPNESPTNRFFVVTEPVSFCVDGNNLNRHQGYTQTEAQSVPPAGGVLLAENIQILDDSDNDGLVDDVVEVFAYSPGTLQRAAIVHLDFRFSDASANDEWVRFSHAVSVRNAP